MYLIADLQLPGRYFADGAVYKTKTEIVNQLASYHSIDFSGCLRDNEECSIFEYLKQFKTVQEKLDYLLEYGEWRIEKIREKNE